MKQYIISILILLITTSIHAQEDSSSAFSRAEIIERNSIKELESMETEISFTYNKSLGAANTVPPFILLGRPISERTEIRFTFNYEPQSNRFILYDYNNSFTTICLGAMSKLIETNNWMSDIYIVNNMFYPYVKIPAPDIKLLDWESVLFFQNEITRRLTVNYSLGYVYFNYYLKSSFEYSACMNYYIIPSLCLFAEHFGFYHGRNSLYEPGWDGGIMYRYKKSQWDLCYSKNYYNGNNPDFWGLTYSRNLSYKTTRKR